VLLWPAFSITLSLQKKQIKILAETRCAHKSFHLDKCSIVSTTVWGLEALWFFGFRIPSSVDGLDGLGVWLLTHQS